MPWLTYRVRYHQLGQVFDAEEAAGSKLLHVTDDGGWYTLFFERWPDAPPPPPVTSRKRKRGR